MSYSTSDLVLAVTLIIHKHELLKVTVDGRVGTFHFKEVSETFLLDYDMGKILVQPQAHSTTIKQLTTAVKRLQSTNEGNV